MTVIYSLLLQGGKFIVTQPMAHSLCFPLYIHNLVLCRLVFHDCIPYVGGGGGCDGCLNMDENLDGNMGLQHTLATLEKLYLEADFPKHDKVPALKASPKDLGISRADLWAFAGIAALDKAQRYTKDVCTNIKKKTSTRTCRWWDEPGRHSETIVIY